jgi:hypothetical protein
MYVITSESVVTKTYEVLALDLEQAKNKILSGNTGMPTESKQSLRIVRAYRKELRKVATDGVE